MSEAAENAEEHVQENVPEPKASEADSDSKTADNSGEPEKVAEVKQQQAASPQHEEDCDREEDEDVPSDFFDDFSNQDFMAGLDIVDVWDEEDVQEDGKQTDKHRSERRPLYKKPRQISRSPNRPRRYNIDRRYHQFYGSKEREYKRRSVTSKDKKKEKGIKEIEAMSGSDCRRDPEKTKRDIQRDKKDKKARIISEKLKVVETGLVPPGMEMEVDLKELKSSVKEDERKRTDIPKEKSMEFEETRASYENRRNLSSQKRRRSHSLSDHPHFPVQERYYSPPRHLMYSSHDKSYDRRAHFQSRSPYKKSRSRSPFHHRVNIERRYMEEKRTVYHYRDAERRKRSRKYSRLSPESNVSEREMWLRQRNYRKNISCSPISDDEILSRRQSKDFLEELASKLNSDRKKKTLLKEIHKKLNETCEVEPRYSMMAVTNSDIMPMMEQPRPVPAPSFVAGQPQQYFSHSDASPYDEQFFIGQPDLFSNSYVDSQYVVSEPHPNSTENANLPHCSSSVLAITQPANSVVHLGSPCTNNNIDILNTQRTAKGQEVITKLFEDKKISLSDFLSLSTNYVDPSQPTNVQKKVMVISLCEDAINALGNDSKLNGRFFLRKACRDVEKKEEVKYQSPLKKIPVVRFRFTTLSKGEEKTSLHSNLNKLLASLSLIEPLVPLQLSLSPIDSESPVPSVKSSSPKRFKARKWKYDPILGAKFQMKMCQTDPVKCHICEIRKARKYEDQGVQYEVTMVDSATQVTEEDVQRLGTKASMKNALKNQSLAHLTPAQILAAQEESNREDVFSSVKTISSPQTPSPCKQNSRDSFTNHSRYGDRYKPNPFNTKNSAGRPKKIFGLMDKIVPNPFENAGKSNNISKFDNRHHVNPKQPANKWFRGNSNFKQHMNFDEDDFDESTANYGGDTPRPFFSNRRGGFASRGGRKF